MRRELEKRRNLHGDQKKSGKERDLPYLKTYDLIRSKRRAASGWLSEDL